MPRYTWIITEDIVPFESSNLVVKKGPSGANDRAPLSVVFRHGSRFRMHRGEGEPPITGYIVGKYTGLEPLEEYGKEAGCTAIEYKHGGEWVKLELAERVSEVA